MCDSSCDGNCLDCLVFDQGHAFLLPVSELLTVTQTSSWAQLTSVSVTVFILTVTHPLPVMWVDALSLPFIH